MHPILFHFGYLSVPTFGALAACGLMLALALSPRIARVACANPDKLWNASLFAVITAFVVSRLLLIATNLHTFLDHPVLLLAVPSLTASGLLLTAVATWFWMRWKHMSVFTALDAWAPCATLVWAFLALGHFMEGSDPGMPTASLLGIRAPGESTPEQPVALYAAAVALLLTAASWWRLPRTHHEGETAAFTLIAAGIAQFLLSFMRQPGLATVAGLDALQLVALGMVVAGIVLFFNRRRDIVH